MEEGVSGCPAQLADLLNQMQHLTQMVAHLQQQEQLQQQAASTAATLPKCPVTVKEFPAFLVQCKLYIELHAWDFPNDKTKTLKQGKNSVAHYSTEFKLLAQDLTWNEVALMDQYMEGLADDVAGSDHLVSPH
ncbi:UNVERIFIED_CONTAM: hypothetical protein K2H54_065389 [Gekko kuhli]